jgi:hypothetical protein
MGGIEYNAEEQAFAETIRKTLISPRRELGSQQRIAPYQPRPIHGFDRCR